MISSLVLLLIPVLLLLQGFFSGSEIAIVSCDKSRLRHKARQGDRGSKLALRMLERPEVILSTTLVGTNISLVLLTALVSTAVIAAVGGKGDFLAVVLLVPFTLVLGEIVPKSVYQQRADDLTPRVVYPLYAFYLLFFPIVFVFSRVARIAARTFGHGSPAAGMFVVREQLRTVLDTAEGAATIDIFDRERIRNVVRFGELVAGDVMIPASEMSAVDARGGAGEVIDLVRRTGSTHFPVYEGKRSQVIGMISASVWDVVQPGYASRTVRELVQPAYFVPLQQPLVELLSVLRNRDDQCAVVVDEYGSAIGMITVDDILQTVVGRIEVGAMFEEPADASRPGYEVVEEDVYLVDARLPIPELNEVLGTNIGLNQARTIGGLIMARLRHVPVTGESLNEAGYRFTVVEATDKAIKRVRAERA
jgi:CBS domain containing-hemolysin-like protein